MIHDENLPILYQNILYGLPSDFAGDVFLWAVERPGEDRACYRAERFAREAEKLVKTLRPIAQVSQHVHGATDAQMDDLMGFILKRHANWRYRGNLNPDYCHA